MLPRWAAEEAMSLGTAGVKLRCAEAQQPESTAKEMAVPPSTQKLNWASGAFVVGFCLQNEALSCEAEDVAQVTRVEELEHRIGIGMLDGNWPNEDRHSVKLVASKSGSLVGAAVFDGHGGWQVAQFLQSALLNTLERELQKEEHQTAAGKDPVPGAMKAAFAECEALLLKNLESARLEALLASKPPQVLYSAVKVGACALCAVVGPAHVYVANAGDCQAFLLQKGEAPKRLSHVHNADQPEEQQRLRQTHPGEEDVFVCRHGGPGNEGFRELAQRILTGRAPEPKLSGCYVKGRLQPTRSFGDFYLKDVRFGQLLPGGHSIFQTPATPPYITAEPEVLVFERKPHHQALVLATDGLWDYLSGLDVATVARETLASPQCASIAEESKAQALADALLVELRRRAADAHGLTEELLQAVPPGPRRRIHDDVTVLVVML